MSETFSITVLDYPGDVIVCAKDAEIAKEIALVHTGARSIKDIIAIEAINGVLNADKECNNG